VFAPTTAAPVSAAIVYELFARGSSAAQAIDARAGTTLIGVPAPAFTDAREGVRSVA
jgi:hypothetical protein